MFRAPCAHRQEVEIVLYSLWYHHTYRWPYRAQVERGRPGGYVTRHQVEQPKFLHSTQRDTRFV